MSPKNFSRDSPLRDSTPNTLPDIDGLNAGKNSQSSQLPSTETSNTQTFKSDSSGSNASSPEVLALNHSSSEVSNKEPRFSTQNPAIQSTVSGSHLTQFSTSQSNPPSKSLLIIIALIVMGIGIVLSNDWIGFAGATAALILSLRLFWVISAPVLTDIMSPSQRSLSVALLGILGAFIGFLAVSGLLDEFLRWISTLNWEAVGALGDVFGAIGQILIAILAVYVAWRQYVISKDLTIQQNTITQQQTIDAYFQGISELVLDAEGLLEDWPQERAIAEGRTAAILGSVDAGGKAKIIRFLSRSRLLTPLRRDRHLGRAMLDGMGGYQEDRDYGIRVIDLGVMLAATNLMKSDLRWTDLSDANLVRANLSGCDLVKANLSRTILYDTNLYGADLMGTRLYYGSVNTATPRTRADIPNYETGEFTGAVIENANLSKVQRLSDEHRSYCCAWGGSKTRATIPGGCEGIPNKLGR